MCNNYMKVVWITGGKGFIGRYLAVHAAEQGCTVFGIGHGLWPMESASKACYAYWCNGEVEAANLNQLKSVSGSPHIIYHLAGGSSVGASLQNPQEDFSRTVETTARLLEWVRFNAAHSKVVSVSSAAIYGAQYTRAIPESASLSPYSPYGFHKAMMEGLCQSYCANFGLQVAIVRLFSIYGAGLEKQLIWDICCKLSAPGIGALELGGTGNEVRDWLHVSDAVKLLWLAGQQGSHSAQIINGGTGVGSRIAEVAEIVLRAWGSSMKIEFSGKARRGDPPSLVADVTLAREIGFRPVIDVESGIYKTIDWFKRHKRD